MNELATICDSPADAACLRGQLEGIFKIRPTSSDRIAEAEPPGQYTIVGINLSDLDRIRDLKLWLRHKPKDAKLVFITERASRLEAVRANAIGATDLVYRPIEAKALLTKLHGDFRSLADAPAEFRAEVSPGIAAALTSLQDVFAGRLRRRPARSDGHQHGRRRHRRPDRDAGLGVLDRDRPQASQPDLSALAAGDGPRRRLRPAARVFACGSEAAVVRRPVARHRQGQGPGLGAGEAQHPRRQGEAHHPAASVVRIGSARSRARAPAGNDRCRSAPSRIPRWL